MQGLERITQTPGVMSGKACLRGMRVTVSMVVRQVAAGQSMESLLADYPYLQLEDMVQALRYAAYIAEGQEVLLATA